MFISGIVRICTEPVVTSGPRADQSTWNKWQARCVWTERKPDGTEQSMFATLVAWNGLASKVFTPWIKEGYRVYVVGNLRHVPWENNAKETVDAYEIVVDKYEFVETKATTAAIDAGVAARKAAKAASEAAPAPAPAPAPAAPVAAEEPVLAGFAPDDIPF